jgi:hypothetical protein
MMKADVFRRYSRHPILTKVPGSDGTVKIYWSGADAMMCVGEANVSDLLALCLQHSRSPF